MFIYFIYFYFIFLMGILQNWAAAACKPFIYCKPAHLLADGDSNRVLPEPPLKI